MRKKPKPPCPRFTLRQLVNREDEVIVEARTAKQQAGYGRMAFPQEGLPPYVELITVEPAHQRCRLGTKIYERLAKAACGRGLRLASDDLRSGYSQAFWEKQVRKGRAVCMGPSRAVVPLDPDKLAWGRGGCARYQLKACPVTSLGRPNRRRRRLRHAKRC